MDGRHTISGAQMEGFEHEQALTLGVLSVHGLTCVNEK